MAKKTPKNTKTGPRVARDKIIRVVVEGKEGGKVIVAAGASTYYTQQNRDATTCCTCKG